jgi:hypothetical protein
MGTGLVEDVLHELAVAGQDTADRAWRRGGGETGLGEDVLHGAGGGRLG